MKRTVTDVAIARAAHSRREEMIDVREENAKSSDTSAVYNGRYF